MAPDLEHGAGDRPASEAGRRYVGEWALFSDWCNATGYTPLPAEPATIEAFLNACPARPATLSRRLTAIEHHHRAAGHSPPERTDTIRDRARGRPAITTRRPLEPDAVDAALGVLPVWGWTGGWFGRRDRALLVLAAAGIPYPQIAKLTAGDLDFGTRAVTVAAGGNPLVVSATDPPATCRACALAGWVYVLNVDAAEGTRAAATALQRPDPDPTEGHACERPTPIHPTTAASPLLPPIDQYGWTALDQPAPLTTRSISRLARRTAAGQHVAHRAIAVASAGGDTAPAVIVKEPVPTYTDQQYQHGIDQRTAARTELDALAAALDDIDTRIADLAARTHALLEGDV